MITAAAERPSTTPVQESQRMIFSVSPENIPVPLMSLSFRVLVVARMVDLELLDLVGVLADLLGELELHEARALLVVAGRARLLVGMHGAEPGDVRPLVLLVVLLVRRILLAR